MEGGVDTTLGGGGGPTTTTLTVPTRCSQDSYNNNNNPCGLGRIWNAQEAVQAWCLPNTPTNHNQEDNNNHNKVNTTTTLSSSETRLISLDLVPSQNVRLIIQNCSKQPLVYSWITPNGNLRGFQDLEPQDKDDSWWTRRRRSFVLFGSNKKNSNNNNKIKQEQRKRRRRRRNSPRDVHVQRTFLGHAFVFGIRKPKQQDHDEKDGTNTFPQENKDADNDDDDEEGVDLKDIIVVGAYRPERLFVPKKKKKKHDNDEEDEFPTHLLTIEPSCHGGSRLLCGDDDDNAGSCGDCRGGGGGGTTTRRGKGFLRGVFQRTNVIEDNNDDDDDDKANWRNYDMDSSWTIRVESVQYSAAHGRKHLIDTTRTKRYQRTTLCGWPVYIEEGCFDDDNEEKKRWKTVFTQDLQYALDHLPEHAKTKLKSIPCCIWINQSFEYGPIEAPEVCTHMCFHPGVDWLKQHKMHKQKVKCVEVYNLDECMVDRQSWGIGGVLLHELSHAYHFTCLPNDYDNADIVECYEQAMKEGLYDSVRVHGPEGPTARAYACENPMEYFAELSTAFLGGLYTTTAKTNRSRNNETRGDDEEQEEQEEEEYNKWYPFCRSQIKEHDPRAYAMLQKMWKIDCEV